MGSLLVLEQSFWRAWAEVCRVVKEEVRVKGMEALNMVGTECRDGSQLGSARGIQIACGGHLGPEAGRL